MSDLYKEFTDFCEKHNRCKDCDYKDIEHCHFSWTEDKVIAEERERIIRELENQKATEEDDSMAEIVSTRIWNRAIQKAIEIVRGGENE